MREVILALLTFGAWTLVWAIVATVRQNVAQRWGREDRP